MTNNSLIFITLVGTTSLSQFYRAMLGPIGPEIILDVGMSASTFALTNTAFFLALLTLQIPIGIAFDRYGAMRVSGILVCFGALGALICALATTPIIFLIGRVLIGTGVAAAFISVVVILSQRVTSERLGFEMAKIFALSNIGTLAASKPTTLLTEISSWRLVHIVAAAASILIGLLTLMAARTEKPRSPRAEGPSLLGGMLATFRLPGVLQVVPILAVTYPALITILGIWAGAYLTDIFSLSLKSRGDIQLAMVIAQIGGILSFGWLDRRTAHRKALASAGGFLSSVLLLLLALLNPSLPVAVCCLVLFCLFSSYNVLLLSYASSKIPPQIAGRGTTTINLIPGVGGAALPIFTSMVFSSGSQIGLTAPGQYALMFAFLAALMCIGSTLFILSRD